ncbi:uncharacterized protein [Lepeophtheirus salmonis]|uniref:uncharacterized protein n=1 Tax=Lepeophtheirus salmonis TaxID=72036 RepID=UPI001AE42DEA|nr:uncharacterized protein LOC121125383 [Lepeophtheirus salmonis]
MSNFVSPYAWISDNGGEEIWTFLSEEDDIMCQICRFKCPFSPISTMEQHLISPTHLRNMALYRTHLIDDTTDYESFNADLTKMLVSCSIPLGTIDHPNFKKFIKKYLGISVPCRYTMNRWVGEVSQDVICKVKEEVEEKDFFIAVDKTKDCRDRRLTSIMIGPLEEDFLYNPYLINLTDISTVNPDIIAHFVVQSIQRTFGNSFNKARFKMFIADGKPHLKKAGEVLQRLYPQLEHISSIESESDNVNEITRKEFSKEIKVIFETKKILLSSEQRKQRFLKMMKTIDTNTSRLSLNSRRDLIIIKWNCKFTDL